MLSPYPSRKGDGTHPQHRHADNGGQRRLRISEQQPLLARVQGKVCEEPQFRAAPLSGPHIARTFRPLWTVQRAAEIQCQAGTLPSPNTILPDEIRTKCANVADRLTDVLTDRSCSQTQFHQVAHVLLRYFLNYANVAAPMICPRRV